jgi:hypothetical protein
MRRTLSLRVIAKKLAWGKGYEGLERENVRLGKRGRG